MPAARAPKTSRIVRDPRIQGGTPTVRGYRTTVHSIVLAAREWGTVEGILRDFPHLSAEDVADALAFYERNREEIDAAIAAYDD